ncbi:hypothetical protein DQ04_00141050 [Trypanosoma grayi]|uniref:hypothetical protein n=1 Tax=Trypanosoma grayi TaxID=71804 RepID=UPI0004F4340F|nr:hypothetical protein DQ04_00141050 [Trypanosoma grayi]KEG15217.1 hypothetical protein DQ04_00141050 [Trypanosoma grayi]
MDDARVMRPQGEEAGLIRVLSTIWDASWEQPQRSPREFFIWPTFPIRYMYTTRLLVNLLWFSRNYLNLAFLISLLVVFFIPPCALVVAVSSSMHLMKRSAPLLSNTPTTNIADDNTVKKGSGRSLMAACLTLLQVLCCIFVWYRCGLLSIVLSIIIVTMPVLSHAFFAPYTDEAFELYCSVLRQRELPVPTPRSPTLMFSAVDPRFTVLSKRESVVVSPQRRSTPRSLISSPRSLTPFRRPYKEEGPSLLSRMKKNGISEGSRRISSRNPKCTERMSPPTYGKVQRIEEGPERAAKLAAPREAENPSSEEVECVSHYLRFQFNREDVALMPLSPTSGVSPVLCLPTVESDGEKAKDFALEKDSFDARDVQCAKFPFSDILVAEESMSSSGVAVISPFAASCNWCASPKCNECLSETPCSERVFEGGVSITQPCMSE